MRPINIRQWQEDVLEYASHSMPRIRITKIKDASAPVSKPADINIIETFGIGMASIAADNSVRNAPRIDHDLMMRRLIDAITSAVTTGVIDRQTAYDLGAAVKYLQQPHEIAQCKHYIDECIHQEDDCTCFDDYHHNKSGCHDSDSEECVPSNECHHTADGCSCHDECFCEDYVIDSNKDAAREKEKKMAADIVDELEEMRDYMLAGRFADALSAIDDYIKDYKRKV